MTYKNAMSFHAVYYIMSAKLTVQCIVLHNYLGISESSGMVYVNLGWENGRNLKNKTTTVDINFMFDRIMNHHNHLFTEMLWLST